jgi:hypothetical protein
MVRQFDFKNAPNIAKNAILPFNPMKYMLAIGSAEYVAWEVLISVIVRALLGFSKKSVMELVQVHAVSLTFMGGAQGFMEAPGDFNASLLTQLKDGAKGIPAILLAKYSVDTCYKGFHIPGQGWTISDTLIEAASKAISRPLYSLLYTQIKGPITRPVDLVNEMVRNQVAKSTLNRNE